MSAENSSAVGEQELEFQPMLTTKTRKAKAGAVTARTEQSPELLFVAEPSKVGSWIDAVERLRRDRHARFGIRLFDRAAVAVATQITAKLGSSLFGVIEQDVGASLADIPIVSTNEVDVVLLIGGTAEQISTALLDYVDEQRLTIVASVTDRYWQNLPLYLISIPKAGTHLLFQLAKALGYRAGGPNPPQPAGGHWYYLLNSNAHTHVSEFFRDELQKAPFGNRAHPFMRSPALFNYRNPLDVLVSEANYWRTDGNSPLYVLLSQLTFDECIDHLIDDAWLLGTIRDRISAFAAWLDCSNIIPVSFEEMVGDAGGGSEENLKLLIWSIQLKLHVPGIPGSIRDRMSSQSSATFREGRINAWRQKLSASARRRFETLPQDFMVKFGYNARDDAIVPAHVDVYRRRPLHLSTVSHDNVPFLVEANYLGCNLIAYQGKYFGVKIAEGDLDLARLSAEQLSAFPTASDLVGLRALIAIDTEAVRKAVETKVEEKIRQSVLPPLVQKYVEKELAPIRESMPPLVQKYVEKELAPIRESMPSLVQMYVEKELARRDNERVGAVHESGSFLGYNLFYRDDALLAVPRRLGAIDPRDHKLQSKPGVIFSFSSVGLRFRIAWAWVRWAYWDGAKI